MFVPPKRNQTKKEEEKEGKEGKIDQCSSLNGENRKDTTVQSLHSETTAVQSLISVINECSHKTESNPICFAQGTIITLEFATFSRSLEEQSGIFRCWVCDSQLIPVTCMYEVNTNDMKQKIAFLPITNTHTHVDAFILIIEYHHNLAVMRNSVILEVNINYTF